MVPVGSSAKKTRKSPTLKRNSGGSVPAKPYYVSDTGFGKAMNTHLNVHRDGLGDGPDIILASFRQADPLQSRFLWFRMSSMVKPSSATTSSNDVPGLSSNHSLERRSDSASSDREVL